MLIKKTMWLIVKIVFWLILIVQLISVAIGYIIHFEIDHLSSTRLKDLVNTAIGIPFYEMVEYKNKPAGLLSIPEDDWYDIKCTNSPLISYMDIVVPSETLAQISPEKKKQLDCLTVKHAGRKSRVGEKSVRAELCSNYFYCKIMMLEVEDYVLQKPDILWNMIMVLERPCDYIETMEEVKKKPKYNGDDAYMARLLKSERKILGCNGKRKVWWRMREEFIVLNIVKSNREIIPYSFTIVVRRQDI